MTCLKRYAIVCAMDHVARGCVIKGFNCLIWVVYELGN
jgi:hypothetical protein